MGVEGIGPSEEELGIKPAEEPTEAVAPEIFEKAQNEQEIKAGIDAEVAEIVERTGLPEKAIQFLVEANRTGKSLHTLAELTSRQEKKPVFVMNNARQGAFLQLGFPHWLANFHSQEQAEEFIGELHADEEYAKTEQELQKKIAYLKELLNEDIDSKRREFLNTCLHYHDPSSSVELELKYELPSDVGSLYANYLNSYLQKVHNGETVFRRYLQSAFRDDDNVERSYVKLNTGRKIAFLLTEIMILKDELRAILLQRAKEWIDDSKIESFVYPINHYKASSGTGEGTRDIEARLFRKIGATLQKDDVILFFGDVHIGGYGHFRSAIFNTNYGNDVSWGRTRSSGLTQSPFERLFEDRIKTSTKIILEYPGTYSSNADNADSNQSTDLTNYQTALARIGKNQSKMVDIWVVSPLQKQEEREFPYTTLEMHYPIRGGNDTEYFTGPSSLRWFGCFPPEHPRERTIDIDSMRQEVERLKGNPSWLREEMPKIFHEANYTFGGPEDEEFLGEVEIEEGKKNE